MNGNFTSSGSENKTADFHNIAKIPFLKFGKSIFSDIIDTHIDLHSARTVMNVNKIGLSHIAPCHNSATNIDIATFEGIKMIHDFTGCNRLTSRRDDIRIFTAVLQLFKFFKTDRSLFIDIYFFNFFNIFCLIFIVFHVLPQTSHNRIVRVPFCVICCKR
ncbi:hypothetical protein SDC9_147481 [bioreactor metagenome]|uniref:Uncharacterized protein n=1 Tax=bioreactor metagenome TaxID=1076179 RepID=A0A645EET8_9ZZZZ